MQKPIIDAAGRGKRMWSAMHCVGRRSINRCAKNRLVIPNVGAAGVSDSMLSACEWRRALQGRDLTRWPMRERMRPIALLGMTERWAVQVDAMAGVRNAS